MIRIGREIQCLPYAEFVFYIKQYKGVLPRCGVPGCDIAKESERSTDSFCQLNVFGQVPVTNLYQMVLVVILVVFALVVLGVANLAVVVLC